MESISQSDAPPNKFTLNSFQIYGASIFKLTQFYLLYYEHWIKKYTSLQSRQNKNINRGVPHMVRTAIVLSTKYVPYFECPSKQQSNGRLCVLVMFYGWFSFCKLIFLASVRYERWTPEYAEVLVNWIKNVRLYKPGRL